MPSQTTTILLKCSMVDVPALNHVKLKSLKSTYAVSTAGVVHARANNKRCACVYVFERPRGCNGVSRCRLIDFARLMPQLL